MSALVTLAVEVPDRSEGYEGGWAGPVAIVAAVALFGLIVWLKNGYAERRVTGHFPTPGWLAAMRDPSSVFGRDTGDDTSNDTGDDTDDTDDDTEMIHGEIITDSDGNRRRIYRTGALPRLTLDSDGDTGEPIIGYARARLREGQSYGQLVRDLRGRYGVSEATAKRRIRDARASLEDEDEGAGS